MATEDFTFPTITTTSSRFIDSPSLWRVSSPSFSDSCHEDTATGGAKREEKEEVEEDLEDSFAPKVANYNLRKSFSYVERRIKTATKDGSDDEEDKMDMLWEDFNEDLSKRNCSRSDSNTSVDEMVELGCVKAFTVSKSGGAILSARRKPAGMVVFVKVLKKLFLLHNSHRSLERH